jgi:Zn-dependent protease
MIDRIIYYISIFLALIVVLPVHELAHAFVAYKCGDNTAKNLGRLTINPLAHFDPIGLICFVLAGFGWAKPVPVNPNNFRKYRKGSFLVAVAGVVANYVLAFIVFPLFVLSTFIPNFGYFTVVLSNALYLIFDLSIVFFIFNLLPIYPLDGFRIVDSFSKKKGKIYYFLRTKGIFVLYFLFLLSIVADITNVWQIDILGNFITFIKGYVSYPIYAFWGLIF